MIYIMVVYYCLRCSNEYNHKSHWKGHLFKNRPCKAEYLDIPGPQIYEDYEELLEIYKEVVEDKKKIYKCGECGFKTAHRSSLYRHAKSNACERMKLAKLKREMEELQSIINNNIDNSVTNNTTDNRHDYVDNSINGDNNRISNNNNYINNYKSEDTTSLTIEKWLEIGDCPPEAISKLVEAIHYSIPTNRNIDLPNVRGNYAKVYEDESWKYIRLVQLLEDLLVNNCDRFYDFVSKHEEVLPGHWVRGINKMLDEVNKEPAKKVQKELIRNVMLNNRE